MTFGYDADVFFSRTTSDIDDHGSSLLVNLIDARLTDEVRLQPQRFRPYIHLHLFRRRSSGPSYS